MYMGETGENTDEWIGGFRRLLDRNNIGWHFWPYKKMNSTRGMVSIQEPSKWNMIVEYTKKDRGNFAKIRENRPPQQDVRDAMNKLLENMKFKNCTKNPGYIQALGMNP